MADIEIQRHFATVDTRWGAKQIHYRLCGAGPVVLLLHQSPQSSAEYEALMRDWADRFTVIAPDYPGFGMSDPLGDDGELELGLPDFAAVLVAFLDEIGVTSAAAYGFHTGAGMAVAMADYSPEHISAVYANGYVILNEQELADILSGYLPRFEPQWDGSHLLWMWTRNRDQLIFFPWFDRREAARIGRTVPSPEVLQQWSMEFLRAGDHYRVGYRAAFCYPGDAPLRRLQVPAIITATENDVLGAFLTRVTDPAPSVVARVGGSMDDNLAEAADFFARHPGMDKPVLPAVGLTRAVAGSAWNKTVQYQHGFIRVRADLEVHGRPLLLVHGAGGSCATVETLFQALRGHRPVLALDLPGHGESDALPLGAAFLSSSSAAIAAVLDAGGIDAIDAWGQGEGATVLVEFSQSNPRRVNRMVLNGLQHLSAAMCTELAERFAPRIKPLWYGGHLLEYWNVARNQHLFWPWYEQTDTAALSGDPHVEVHDLHARTLALMQSHAVLPAAARELFAYPLVGTLRELQTPVLLTAAPSDPYRTHAQAAAAELRDTEFCELPEETSAWVDVMLKFLDGAS